jgi:hypothetical protein
MMTVSNASRINLDGDVGLRLKFNDRQVPAAGGSMCDIKTCEVL